MDLTNVGLSLSNMLSAPFQWGATLGRQLGGMLVNPERSSSTTQARAPTVQGQVTSPANSVTRDNFATSIWKGVQGAYEKIGSAVTASTAVIGGSFADAKARATTNTVFNGMDNIIQRAGNTITGIITTTKSVADTLRGLISPVSQDAGTNLAVRQISGTDTFSIPASLLPIIFSQRDTSPTSGYLYNPAGTSPYTPTAVEQGSAAPQPVANAFTFNMNTTIMLIGGILLIVFLFVRRTA